jgi:glutamine synthetase
MGLSMDEVLQFARENDVQFIRLAFCDVFGVMKNISIRPSELEAAFAEGVAFDAGQIEGFRSPEAEDGLFLHPDPSTLSILPWRPQSGRVARLFCDVRTWRGEGFARDARAILKGVSERLLSAGIKGSVGTESEFYLFECGEDGLPTRQPHDGAGYFDVAPLDKCENLRREISLTLDEMGLAPLRSCHKAGPGQNEIVFRHSGILEAADAAVSFRSVVKSIASKNGLFASFMPKPLPFQAGNGLHVNLSLEKGGRALFASTAEETDKGALAFLAGVLRRLREISVFLNASPNSYQRLGAHSAPGSPPFSFGNRSELIRIPRATSGASRMELRSPDATMSPYLALALIVSAGMEGIEDAISPDSKMESLPASLKEAAALARESKFCASVIGEETLDAYCSAKAAEWEKMENAEDRPAYQHERYFGVL